MTESAARQAAAALCRVLRAENAALSALDIPKANVLLAEKILATDQLSQALLARPKLPEAARDEITTLLALATENKKLLERAMLAQKRVLACIARAVPRALGQAGAYAAGGKTKPPQQMPPIALSARV
jgi:hypothetical protein